MATVSFGDYVVVNNRNGHFGRVTEIHPKCPQGRDWIEGPRAPVTAAQVAAPWVSILVRGGGAVVVPMSDCEVIEPFDMHNRFTKTYWPEG